MGATTVMRAPWILLFACLSPALSAQELLWERVGVAQKYSFGFRVVALGDVNGDGYDDLLHMVHKWSVGLQLWTLSGKDGSTIRIRPGLLGSDFLRITATGDMNGDKIPDYAVLIATGGLVTLEVASGKDDKAILRVKGLQSNGFGEAILGDLDLDGDRKPDLVVVEPLASPLPRIKAYSNTGKLLYSVSGTANLVIGCARTDQAIGTVGDIDGDGRDDFVVGACGGIGGAAAVLSGKTGKVLRAVYGLQRRDNLGGSMDGCGDMDGDGVPDFVVGSGSFFSGAGVVYAFSGKTGKVLRTWRGTKACIGNAFAESLASAGIDVDRDGVPDVMVGAQGEGRVHIFSGRDGSAIWRFGTGCNSRDGTGQWVAVLPPQPGSPFPLLVVPEWGYRPWCSPPYCGRLGRLRVYRGSPAGVNVFGAACRNSLPTTPRIGIRDLGAKGLRLHLSGGAAGAPAVLLLGLSRTNWGSIPLPLGLAGYGYPGCKLYTSIELFLLAKTGSTGVSRGYTFFDLPLPLSPKGKLTLHGQWLSSGTGTQAPGGLSDAIVWRSK
jgi:FG-GAP-like repeat/FG-GAP repeat